MANGRADAPGRDREAAATMAEQLGALAKMTTGELAQKYREVFGVPTRTNHKEYLRKRIAWKIQETAEGGLSARALARIEELAALAPTRWNRPAEGPAVVAATPMGAAAPEPATAPTSDRDPRLPPPGTVLTRTHKGVEHRVTVLEDGVEYNGERHRSLSRVARLIAGTPWNGFLFFGLADRARRGEAKG